MRSDRERVNEFCDWAGHHWMDVYMGVRCSQCGLFYPDDPDDCAFYDDDEPDYTDWFSLQTIGEEW